MRSRPYSLFAPQSDTVSPMIISHITRQQLDSALATTNQAHGYQLIWKQEPTAINAKATRFRATIRSKRSKVKGARYSASYMLTQAGNRRALSAASWHAHGHLFEAILAIEPNAVIRTGLQGKKVIDRNGGNWEDSMIGAQCAPVMASELSIGEE